MLIHRFYGHIFVYLYYLIENRIANRKEQTGPENEKILGEFNGNGKLKALKKQVFPKLLFVSILNVHFFKRNSLIFLFFHNRAWKVQCFDDFESRASKSIESINGSIDKGEDLKKISKEMLELLIQIFIAVKDLLPFPGMDTKIETVLKLYQKYKNTYVSNKSDEWYTLVLEVYRSIFRRRFKINDGYQVNKWGEKVFSYN